MIVRAGRGRQAQWEARRAGGRIFTADRPKPILCLQMAGESEESGLRVVGLAS